LSGREVLASWFGGRGVGTFNGEAGASPKLTQKTKLNKYMKQCIPGIIC